MQPRDFDPDILGRWLTIASLIATAPSMLARQGGAWVRLALITADTATEAILGLLGSEGPTPPDERATFEQVYEAAVLALRDDGQELPRGLGARIRQAHRLRNMAIHHGSEPAANATERAIRAAEDLRDVATSRSPVLAAFRGAGPIVAVGGLVGRPTISLRLAQAAAALDRGDTTGAADHGAIAFDRALRLVRPPLRQPDPYRQRTRLRRSPSFTTDPLQALNDVERALDEANKRTQQLETWVLALGVGLQPRDLAELYRVLGRPIYYLAPEPSDVRVVRGPEALVQAEVEAALLTVADVIFRLWLSDSFAPSETS